MIIESLLDLDLYKISMMYAVFKKFPDTTVEYKFKSRNLELNQGNINFLRLKKEFDHFQGLKFDCEDVEYLRGLKLFDEDFLTYLSGYSNNNGKIIFHQFGDPLNITIQGKWIDTILYEVPVLAIVNEVYFEKDDDIRKFEWKIGREKSLCQINYIKQNLSNIGVPFKFMEFGTRRRYSKAWQEYIISRLVSQKKIFPADIELIGTSNVMFAKQFKINPMGTMAHEYLMCGQAKTNIADSQIFMLHKWLEVYGQKLGIALTDTIGMNAFIRDMELSPEIMGNLEGFRQDSGKPIPWINKIIQYFNSIKYNKPFKFVFSDGLDFVKCKEILEHISSLQRMYDRNKKKLSYLFEDKSAYFFDPKNIIPIFGIGTFLTNNMVRKPLNIVIKATKFDGFPVVKISDSPSKSDVWDVKEKDVYEGLRDYVVETFKSK